MTFAGRQPPNCDEKSQKNSCQCAKTSLDRRKMEKSNFILVVKVNDFTGKNKFRQRELFFKISVCFSSYHWFNKYLQDERCEDEQKQNFTDGNDCDESSEEF